MDGADRRLAGNRSRHPPRRALAAQAGRSPMATELRKEYAEMQEMLGQVPSWIQRIPEPGLQPFWTMLRDFQLSETRIPNKYKELIGLAVSGATRCRYC